MRGFLRRAYVGIGAAFSIALAGAVFANWALRAVLLAGPIAYGLFKFRYRSGKKPEDLSSAARSGPG